MDPDASLYDAANKSSATLERSKWQAPPKDSGGEGASPAGGGPADAAEAAPAAADSSPAPSLLCPSMRKLEFAALWKAYPLDASALAACGGGVGALLAARPKDEQLLACLSLSAAINASFALDSSSYYSGEKLLSGAGQLFIAKPSEMLVFFSRALGKPHHCKDIASASGRKGIIVFLEGSGEDAVPTYVDLWDGASKGGGGGRSARAQRTMPTPAPLPPRPRPPFPADLLARRLPQRARQRALAVQGARAPVGAGRGRARLQLNRARIHVSGGQVAQPPRPLAC